MRSDGDDQTREHADAAILVQLADAIELLFEYRIDAEIAHQAGRHADAGGVGQRDAQRRKTLVRERAEMAPAADLELSGEARLL